MAGSGALGDLGAHIIDMARFVTGDEFSEITGAITETFIKERNIPSAGPAGGIAGGISTGQPVKVRVAFKPTSSIRIERRSIDRHLAATVVQTLGRPAEAKPLLEEALAFVFSLQGVLINFSNIHILSLIFVKITTNRCSR